MNKNEILANRQPVKPIRHRVSFKHRLKYVYAWIQVKLGFRVWGMPVYSRPKFQICPIHQCNMKRGSKTEKGAYYYCQKCRRYYHLEGGGLRIVPNGRK